MTAPLDDRSDGALKGWPGGSIHYPNGEIEYTFRRVLPGERPIAIVLNDQGGMTYCKYCYDDTLPLTMREEVIAGRATEMTICAECGYGLTPPEEVT